MTASLRPFGFDGQGVRAVVTTRHGGASTGPYAGLNLGDHVGDDPNAVLANRRMVAGLLDVEAITIADQQHTATVAVVDDAVAGRGMAGLAEAREVFPATDALVTDRPGVALGVLVADCAPVVLWDSRHRAVGVVHAGRQGVVRRVLANALARMGEAFGTRPADVIAGIGPCIGMDSYEVGADDAAAVDAAVEGATRPGRPGHAYVDLRSAVRGQLAELGVTSVESMDVDTRQATEDFFSDRAQRPCGRFMAIAMIEP